MTTITQRVVERARSAYGVTVLTHSEWGSQRTGVYTDRRARTARGGYGRFIAKADTLAFHITVTRDDGPTLANFKADMGEVERIGQSRFGSGISYNFCIDMQTGEVGVGQPLDSKGTHTVNDKRRAGYSHDQNLAARAISAIGMPGDGLSEAALRSYAGLIAAMMDEGAITEDPDALPHSFFAAKDCPTDAVRDHISEIMTAAKALRAPAAKPEPKPTGKPKPATRITEARAILREARKAAKAAPRKEKIRRALKALPKR